MTTPMIKICGITRVDDALCAVDEGADFIGLNFVPSSPRRVERAQAVRIASAVRQSGAAVRLVAVFVDESPPTVKSIAEEAGFDLIQFHGSESPELLAGIGIDSIKVFRLAGKLPDTSAYEIASWFLFDSFHQFVPGGTGQAFDWSVMAQAPRDKPFFLAGGLRPDNVRRAVAVIRPDGLDVASGVEDAPGVKSRDKIRQLIQAVRKGA
ncbi:MAG: phosphoribosylanthranilate isomerase [Acidobacteriota bacterium]